MFLASVAKQSPSKDRTNARGRLLHFARNDTGVLGRKRQSPITRWFRIARWLSLTAHATGPATKAKRAMQASINAGVQEILRNIGAISTEA